MISFILNIPYTVCGLILAIVSYPTSFSFRKKPHCFVIHATSFWWAVGYMKGARAATLGHLVLLSNNLEKGDLEHELIHVEQYTRMPVIHPFLYYVELIRKGYRNNKYEDEAYRRAGNLYKNR
jgi:hypothetical protein